MGGRESKIKNPNANIVNNIKVIDHTSNLDSIWYLSLATMTISLINLLINLYLIHKRSKRKR